MSILDNELTPTSMAGLQVRKATDANPNLNVLIYGDFGAGKTRLCGSSDEVPDMRKVLFIDIEGGTFTLKHSYPNTDVVRVTNWNQLGDIYNELRAGLYNDYNTIVVDSLSEAQVFNMDEIMRQLVKLKPERSEDVPDIREWGINQKQVKRFIRAFRDLPRTVIMTALMKEDKLPDNSRRKGPDLPGKLASQVPALFDEVWYLYVRALDADQRGRGENFEGKKETRLLSTGMTSGAAGKDRSGKLPPIIVEPNMQQIWNIMMKGSQQ